MQAKLYSESATYISDHVLGFQEDSATPGAVVHTTSSWRQAVASCEDYGGTVLVAIGIG